MSTSLSVAPSLFVISQAFVYVLSVVPKHGIVTAANFASAQAQVKSNAFAVTRSASEESSPPEIPITAL